MTLKSKYENPAMQEANRLFLNQRVQQQGESVFDFINAIQELAVSCNRGLFYEEAMKGRLVCGIQYQETRVKLLAPDLTLEQAKIIALPDDTVRLQMKSLARATVSVSAVQVHHNRQQQSKSANEQQRKPPEQQHHGSSQHQHHGSNQ